MDTILYVFGPKRANGTYSHNPVAFNDDMEPGVNLGSHIVFDVPRAGRYRIVVSTYDNWLDFPYHVSRGTYQLIVKCQGGVFGSCGPAVSGIDGECWADTDCLASDGTPHHCQGEVTCAPGTECLFVRQGVCVEDYAWMTYAPKQCSNPWSHTEISDQEAAGYTTRELAQIVKYYRGLGLALDEVGELAPSEPTFHCLACSCSRGDAIAIKVNTLDAAVLGARGWLYSSTVPPGVSLAPRQCGSNPWQTSPTTDPAAELELVDTWLGGMSATVSLRGFAYPIEPIVGCTGCGCPRGDRLLAFPTNPESAGVLSSEGFADLYVP